MATALKQIGLKLSDPALFQESCLIDGAWVAISARSNSQSEKKEGEKLLYSERTHESYARSFELPQAVDSERAAAKFENGVLVLTLPKKEGPRSTKLQIS